MAGTGNTYRGYDDKPTVVVDGPRVLVTVALNDYKITVVKRNLDHFDAQDPYFFDSDYTLAGSTGFLLWEANWLVLRLLRSTPLPPAPPSPAPYCPAPNPSTAASASAPSPSPDPRNLASLFVGKRVLDLGSGTGLAGLCAAACGAHVLLTDLASVVAGSLRANVARNATAQEEVGQGASAKAETAAGLAAEAGRASQGGPADAAPSAAGEGHPVSFTWGRPAAVAGGSSGARGSGPWSGAVPVGRGSAAVMALDWTEPLAPQVAAGGNDPRDADFILAVDTIWLLDILHSFIDVVLAVLSHGARTGAPAGAPRAEDGGHAAAAAGAVATPGVDDVPGAASPTGAAGDSAAPSTAGVENTAGVPGKAGFPGSGSAATPRACYLAFVERAGAESKLFVRKEAVESELRARGCCMETVLAEDVDVDGVARPGRVLRVTLAGSGVQVGG